MNLADLATFGKVLGIPGVCILTWYLLEKGRGERASKLDEQRLAAEQRVEEQRIAAENRRTEVMEAGFKGIGLLIQDHSEADIRSHAEQTERIARIEAKLNITARTSTPAQGIREITRARSQGDR